MMQAMRTSLLALVVWAEMMLATAVAFPTAARLFLANRIEPAVGVQHRCAGLLGSRIDGQASPGPSTISVSMRDGHSVRIDLAEGTATANGCLWNGTVSETGEAAILMAWNDGRLTGSICYRGKILAIAASDRKLAAAPEFEPKLASASHALAGKLPLWFRSADRSALASAADLREREDQPAPTRVTLPFSDRQRAALEARKVTIDLMVLYTRRAGSRYVLDMRTLIATAIEQINASFRNSGVGNVGLRLVHAEPIDYVETELGHFDHLYRMVDGVGAFDRVGKLRDDNRADIVGLIVDDPSQCGLATRVAPDPEEAYFVVHHSCALLSFSMAHEIGHILGARHEPQIDAGNAPASYGFGYVNGNEWRDIMSYAQSCSGCPRLPRWSNPRVQYQGQPTGTLTSDAARVILEQADRIAHFR
jgi:Metallo-peptidase family M12